MALPTKINVKLIIETWSMTLKRDPCYNKIHVSAT